MGIEQARQFLEQCGRAQDILEFDVSSATVALAAQALNTEEGRIAKSLSFKNGAQPLLIIAAGHVRIDNTKFRREFACKAKMLSPEEVRELIGHEVGGVCPFGVKEDVAIYLDVSLRSFDYVFPACGSANSAIRLTCEELEDIVQPIRWVDVGKTPASEPAA